MNLSAGFGALQILAPCTPPCPSAGSLRLLYALYYFKRETGWNRMARITRFTAQVCRVSFWKCEGDHSKNDLLRPFEHGCVGASLPLLPITNVPVHLRRRPYLQQHIPWAIRSRIVLHVSDKMTCSAGGRGDFCPTDLHQSNGGRAESMRSSSFATPSSAHSCCQPLN